MTEQVRSTPLNTPQTRPRDPGGDNVVDLLGRLTSQGAHLAQEQVALMQAEIREGASDIRKVIAAYASAAIFGLSGLGVTLMGLGWLLGDFMNNVPVGILIAGVATLAIAAVLYAGASSKLKATHLKPERTIRTLEDTPDIVTGTHTAQAGEATRDHKQ